MPSSAQPASVVNRLAATSPSSYTKFDQYSSLMAVSTQNMGSAARRSEAARCWLRCASAAGSPASVQLNSSSQAWGRAGRGEVGGVGGWGEQASQPARKRASEEARKLARGLNNKLGQGRDMHRGFGTPAPKGPTTPPHTPSQHMSK